MRLSSELQLDGDPADKQRYRNVDQMLEALAKLYDYCDHVDSRSRLESWVVRLAAGGFVIHLVLILLARSVPFLNEGILSNLDRNFLHAVYTPFSFILFYEVLLLVLALPKSHTSSVGKQYEIVSLIVIRRVFKDIGEFRDPWTWLSQLDAALMVMTDMFAAALMFLIVTAFYRVRRTVIRAEPPKDLRKFILTKKAVAVLLCVVLLGLAAYNLADWVMRSIPSMHEASDERMDLDLFFFPAFFEFMVFTDVFLLIISLPLFERYEYLIRNAGFVVSTILLRFSLSTPKPYDLLVGLVAMLYGLCIVAVFAHYTRVAAESNGGETSKTT